MPSRSNRHTAKKEPSYKLGVPIDGDDSALQPADPFDSDETAQDHAAPPADQRTSTEVAVPEPLPMEEPPAEPAPAPQPARPGNRATASSRRTAAAGASGMSGRQAAGRSSRRATAATSTAAPRVSSRRASAIDRAALQKALLWIGVGVLCAIVVIAGIVLLATKGGGDRKAGQEAITEAERQFEAAKTAIANRRGSEARTAYENALKALTGTPQLGGAVAMPPEDGPVVRDLAIRAFEMRGEVEKLNDGITAVKNENAADANLAALKGRFASLTEASTDLDALERSVLAFIDNPVDPQSGPSPTHAQAFARLVQEAKLRLPSIATERDRRKTARTAGPLRLTGVEVDGLVQQERFGEALLKIEAVATANPDADFGPLRGQVEDAADKAWRSAKAQVETRLADWKSAGAAESQRQLALTRAKERLNQVISRFGIPSYVDQARSMLTPLP